MKKLLAKLRKISKLDEGKIWIEAADNEEVKDEVIRLNTIEQLFEKGIDSNDNELEDYSPFTVVQKQLDGQPFDRTTLNDTGEFYDSFKVEVNKNGLKITANPIKDDSNLFDDYTEEVVGLTEDSKKDLGKTIRKTTIRAVKRAIRV